jgi:hypothetical protein
MLAGVETMMRHRDILQGAKFVWLTDHKGLIHLLNQCNLSGHQARWIKKIGEFNFEVTYLLGVENLLPDVLSRMYAFDSPGMVRAPREYTEHNIGNKFQEVAHLASMPLTVGQEALPVTPCRSACVASRMASAIVQPVGDQYVLGSEQMVKKGVKKGLLLSDSPVLDSATPHSMQVVTNPV